MPKAVHRAYGYVKKATATVNGREGRLPGWMTGLIERVCDEVISGQLDDDFSLYVWKTGSGTQSNMNLNEVISNRAIQLTGGQPGSKTPVHPNDHVNMCQSSNDTFPAAMHIAAIQVTSQRLRPSVQALQQAIAAKASQWRDVVKTGRTHLQDAVPLTVGQEWSRVRTPAHPGPGPAHDRHRRPVRAGHRGTAVGTGLNAPPGAWCRFSVELVSVATMPLTDSRR